MKRYHKPKKVKQPNIRPVTIFWGILCLTVSIILCCLLLMTISSFVGNKLDILKYTKDSQIIDGVVRTVSTAWVNNPGKYDWDYTLDSVVVAYNNEQGEEILFTSDKYRKSWDVAQNIKLIANPTDMDIAYFDVITFRYAPMQLKQSAIPYLSLSIFLIMLIWYFSMYGFELLRAPVRLEDSVKAKHEKKTKDLKDIDTVETNTKKADAKEKDFKKNNFQKSWL